jgi:hypothetical protein
MRKIAAMISRPNRYVGKGNLPVRPPIATWHCSEQAITAFGWASRSTKDSVELNYSLSPMVNH